MRDKIAYKNGAARRVRRNRHQEFCFSLLKDTQQWVDSYLFQHPHNR
jgi:hypothetical protein